MVFEIHLLHASHLQVNLDVFEYNFVFPGCACRLSTTTNQLIFQPNCVLHFLEAAWCFSTISWTMGTFLEFETSLKLW